MTKSLENIQKILVMNLAFIGDVVLSTPVTRVLREAYPQAVMDMLVVPVTAEIASGNPFVNEVLVYDKRGQHKKLGQLLKLIWEIRSRHYDLAVCTNFAARGAMLAWIAGIPYRAGYDRQHANLFLTHIASGERSEICHEAENYLAVLKPLGITTADTTLTFQVQEQDKLNLAAKVPKLTLDQPIAVVCPSGSYPRKSWTISAYAELICRLAEESQVVLIGGGREAAELSKISQASADLAGKNVASVLAGELSLGELAALLQRCKVLVSIDTGPMHIAQAVGTPVVALFGPTDPAIWGPRGLDDHVFYEKLSCSPCWGKGDCTKNRCMTDIAAEKVIEAALRQIRK
ncbi:putative lipopolysaccharide heptosyltransferase III [Sporomusaceae bacterium BoRhaA]|uniref:lipopolysaccharide heptosyltransferase II n=1 Tax=Pelorhabdus rhamnosifermentans TaxID=2772457 RepID=UPI001C06328E|nr:lipopolysaccharide heptosyltransferase II [Pelorhabdus rhamnosifermentans]MBU2699015.1 putative lipopolysaccharide heptosyltransferase III [Pelorhabdus rhamnosifermentans]